MPKKDYLEDKVVDQLSKKLDLRIQNGHIMELIDGKGDVGIHSRGKIDFLVKYCGYVHMWVDEFPKN